MFPSLISTPSHSISIAGPCLLRRSEPTVSSQVSIPELSQDRFPVEQAKCLILRTGYSEFRSGIRKWDRTGNELGMAESPRFGNALQQGLGAIPDLDPFLFC